MSGARMRYIQFNKEEWGRLRHDYGTCMYSIPNHIDPDSVNRMTRCQEDEAIRLHVRTE